MGEILSQVKTQATAHPKAIIAYGPPGAGKTSWAAHSEGVVFLCDIREQGIEALRSAGIVPPHVPVLPFFADAQQLSATLEELRTEDHTYRHLVVDTAGGAERVIHNLVCTQSYGGNWAKFGAYKAGYDAPSHPIWNEFLNKLDALRHERGMSITLLAHATVRECKNPLGENYDELTPALHPYTWGWTHAWADAVLCFRTEVEVKDGRARGGRLRNLYTESIPGLVAKNRHALPPVINLGSTPAEGWANFVAAFQQPQKGGA